MIRFLKLAYYGLTLAFVSYRLYSWFTSSSSTLYSFSPPQNVVNFEEEDTFEPLNEEVFRSYEAFLFTYKEMERDFKVFVYPEADLKLSDFWPGKGFREHESEGYFVENLMWRKFATYNPEEAHLFFVPFSCQQWSQMQKKYPGPLVVEDFVRKLISKYPYWNRTLGADHFYFACPGVDMLANATAQYLLKNSIRLVPSPTYNKEFLPRKDVALPQPGESDGLLARAFDSKNRIMLNFWRAPSELNVAIARTRACENAETIHTVHDWHYQMEWYRNIFCICPDELQVIGACVTASIRSGCVPVVRSTWYDLPFNNILDWQKFSVVLNERNVSHVKKVLDSKDYAECARLQRNTLSVKRHLQWNLPAKKQDAFHMVLYTLWMRRYVIRH